MWVQRQYRAAIKWALGTPDYQKPLFWKCLSTTASWLWDQPSQEPTPTCQDQHLAHKIHSLCKEGQLDRAIDALLLVSQQGFAPSPSIYRSVLRACIKTKALPQAKLLHAHLVICGLDSITYLAEYLVTTLSCCGGLKDALRVFRCLPHRSVHSWAAIIFGYSNCGNDLYGLEMYLCMLQDGVQPDVRTFVSLLEACANIPSLFLGECMHAEAVSHSCEMDPFVGEKLLEMYAKCGSISDAQNAFDHLSVCDVVSWTVLLSAYTEVGQARKTLELFKKMHMQGVQANERTFLTALQACCALAENSKSDIVEGGEMESSLKIGQALHADVRKQNFESNEFICSALLSLYGKCGSIVEMENVFSQYSGHTLEVWTSMLSAYVEQGKGEKALQVYSRMQHDGATASRWMFVSALQACCLLAEEEEATLVRGQMVKQRALEIGKALHAETQREGLDSNGFVSSTLMLMYGKCGSPAHTKNLFDEFPHPDIISWTVMLSAYIEQGDWGKALQLYREMQTHVSADERAILIALQACCMLAEKEESVFVNGKFTKVMSLGTGQELHNETLNKGFELDVFICSALMSMYGKCGRIMESESIFHGLWQRDVVLWTTMIKLYVEQGQPVRALELYREMQEKGIIVNDVTLVCVLQACCETANLEICWQIHFKIISGFANQCFKLANSLMHAYGSCGAIFDAREVFDNLPQPNVVSWTSLIASYGRPADYMASKLVVQEMEMTGIKPNACTFATVLWGCCHVGIIDRGIYCFQSMNKDFDLTPGIEHYILMMDLFGRAGDFTRVENLLSSMQKQPHLTMWLSLLNSCRKHGNIDLGKQVYDLAVGLEPDQAIAYVLMSDIVG